MAFWVLVLPGSWRVGLVPGLEQQFYEACVHAPTPIPSDVLVRFAVRLWERGAQPVGIWSAVFVGSLQVAGCQVCLLPLGAGRGFQSLECTSSPPTPDEVIEFKQDDIMQGDLKQD